MNQPFDEITETLRDYFDGIYESSEEKMRRGNGGHCLSLKSEGVGRASQRRLGSCMLGGEHWGT